MPPTISSETPDWSREHYRPWTWQPPRALLASIRLYQRHSGQRSPRAWLMRKLAVVRYRFWSVVTAADIPINTRIGGGLLIPHPNGVTIHAEAVIGPNCLILQQVTLGTGGKPGVPRIGGHVDIGAGAKLLGGIRIGEHAVIGANAVVIDDVPPYGVAVGVPAVVKRIRAGEN